MMWLRLAVSCRDRHTAQTVVGAERDDQHPHVALERAVEARARVSRRLSRDAGVHDLVGKSGAADALVQQGRIRDSRADAVAGRQAVAEADDAAHWIKCSAEALTASALSGDDAQKLEHQVRREQRGDLTGAVERRRDLDDVAADEGQAGQTADELLRFVAGQAAHLRRAGARREGGSTESMSNVM